MKCPNCGAEIDKGGKCEFCGSKLSAEMQKENEQINKDGCPKCKSTNITFEREKHEIITSDKKISYNYKTVGLCKDCGFSWDVDVQKEKHETNIVWWILGWIIIYPIPATILINRSNKISNKKKRIYIALLWISYIILVAISNSQEVSQ